MGKIVSLLFFYKDSFGMNNNKPKKFAMSLNKKTKLQINNYVLKQFRGFSTFKFE